MELSDSITQNVRDALYGDKEACKKLNILLQLPFSSIKKLYHTSEEDKYALSIIAYMKVKMNNDSKGREFLNSKENAIPELSERKKQPV
jgi:hypothetical protein